MKKLMILTAGLAAGAMAWAPAAHASEDGITVSVGSITVVEGDTGTARVPLTLSAPAPAGGVCLAVSVGGSDDSAVQSDDYLWAGGLVTVPAGQDSASVQIPLVDDLDPEATKTISVDVRQVPCPGAASASVIRVQSLGKGTVTILDNDDLPVTGGSATLAWCGLGSLAVGATVLLATRRRQRLA